MTIAYDKRIIVSEPDEPPDCSRGHSRRIVGKPVWRHDEHHTVLVRQWVCRRCGDTQESEEVFAVARSKMRPKELRPRVTLPPPTLPGVMRLDSGKYACKVGKIKPYYEGGFDTQEEAHAAYKAHGGKATARRQRAA